MSYCRFKEMGSKSVFTNESVIDYGDILILSIKPQVVPKVLPELKNNKKLLLSIAMGISLSVFEKVQLKFRVILFNPFFLTD